MFYEETLLRHKIRDECLRGMPDVERLCRKLVVGRATLQDLCTLYQFSAKLPELVEQLQSYAGQHQTALQTMFVEALTLRSKQLFKYGGLIASAVDLEVSGSPVCVIVAHAVVVVVVVVIVVVVVCSWLPRRTSF